MAKTTKIGGAPTNGMNPWVDSLVWGGAWTSGNADLYGATTITYYIASGDDKHKILEDDGYQWRKSEVSALNNALSAWESVADIDFVRSRSSPGADIWYWLVTEGDANGNLGYHEPPGYAIEPLYGQFNREELSRTEMALGGYDFNTFLHEIGHGLGLAHPHDGGSSKSATKFPGVTERFGDYGDYGLNQGIWTVMSYNDGWPSQYPSKYDEIYSGRHGYPATPMALDIAAVQSIYGANMSHAIGDDVYTLPTVNARRTFWSWIWDAGGQDTISAAAAMGNCTIDLNPATLMGANAGGYVSSAVGIFGGFTIANGATIENAIGGFGSDTLIGNAAANVLRGGAGQDSVIGGAGSDILLVSAGEIAPGETYDGGDEFDILTTDADSLDLLQVTVTGIESIATTNSAGTAFVVSSVDLALLVHGSASRNDSLTLSGATLTEAQRTQIFAQDVEIITDAEGTIYNPSSSGGAPIPMDLTL